MSKENIYNFPFIFKELKIAYHKQEAPAVTLISNLKKTPYHVLVSTIISLRTKDQVTLQAAHRLFAKAQSIDEILKLSEPEIAKIIYPAGFYKTKAGRLKEMARIIRDQYHGKVPDTIGALLKLPGVGRKTANLVLALGFQKDAICVDTHVHRISNRLGWVKTKTPEETEFALYGLLPKKFWKDINDYLVSYGQITCKPISPFCSKCTLNDICPKNNVIKSR